MDAKERQRKWKTTIKGLGPSAEEALGALMRDPLAGLIKEAIYITPIRGSTTIDDMIDQRHPDIISWEAVVTVTMRGSLSSD